MNRPPLSATRPARPAFTLVELLVVMALMILLAALVVGVSESGMFGSQKVISAGDRASGWLLIAKQRAVRDGAPRGVRFFSQPGNANSFTEAQYIESPAPWVPNPAQEANPSGARIVFVYGWQANSMPQPGTSPFLSWVMQEIYYVGSANDINEFDQRVSQGDSLFLPEFGRAFQITGLPPAGSVPPNTYLGPPVTFPPGPGPTNSLLVDGSTASSNCRRLVLAAMPDMAAAGSKLATSGTVTHPATLVTYKFGFTRSPQPLLGEPGMQLSGGTAIDYRQPLTSAAIGGQPLTETVGVDSTNTPIGYRDGSGGPPSPYWPKTTLGVNPQTDSATLGGLYFDILFSPSGQLLNTNAGLVVLWVRDTSKNVAHPRIDSAGNVDTPLSYDQAGQQVFVVVNGKNGLISTQAIVPPVAPAGYDAYQSAKDGINSGL
jgi:type II secretory pathway pseudopilin PulG